MSPMNTSRQLNLPAREVKRLSAFTETHGKPVSVAVDVCDLVVSAFVRKGYNRQQAAGLLNMKESQFSKAFSANYPDQNTVMKRLGQIPGDVLREFAALLAERVGLSIGINAAKVEASERLADAVLNVLKVSAR